MAEEPSLDERAAAAAKGDRDATRAVVEEILPMVRNLVRYLVFGDQHVDDLAQDALIAIVRGLPTWRGEGSFEGWAKRVAVRAVFASLKKIRRRTESPLSLAPELVSPDESAADVYRARRQVAHLLDQLPEEQRRVVVLHHAAGLSMPEVAEELEIPFETARSRLRLGMKRLRQRSATMRGSDD